MPYSERLMIDAVWDHVAEPGDTSKLTLRVLVEE
jgi:hypothetical protein